ncbi:Cacna1c [Symbiodinium pilosum]|uniref:Cacna1c protein n=1 Tax=Symbiodinium pilosum TaxID=2952 RepID=A0A812YFT7_SYMPI|nr:Cacna1c [Symbiodinium pilosum]
MITLSLTLRKHSCHITSGYQQEQWQERVRGTLQALRHPIVFLEPFVSVVIVANAILTGFQTDPQYRTWPGWIYVEMSFATVLMFETWLFILHCLILKTWFKCSSNLYFL